MMTDAKTLIKALDLQPHPEGGYYLETFRSDIMVETDQGLRSSGTAIFYLLEKSDVSRLHRIDADEIWHFYQGDPLEIYSLEEGGTVRIDRLSAENPQIIIKAGVWFGAAPAKGSVFCLAGCTVIPAFEFSGFELADQADLLKDWPEVADLIRRLT